MTLVDFLEQHYAVHRIVSVNYDASIRSGIRTFERYLTTLAADEQGRKLRPRTGPPVLADFSDAILLGLSAWMLGEAFSRPSVNRVLRTLCALAKFARRRGLTTYRPDVEKVPEKLPRPTAWRRDELRKIFRGIVKLYGDSAWGRRLLALMLIYRDTAVRAIDALRMESTPTDFAKGVLFVSEKKTGKRRGYELSKVTMRAIVRNGGTAERPVPYPYKETQPIRKRLRRVLKAEGLPHGRRDLLQKLRRTTATIAHHEGQDATELLGHSARWVTQKYYIDADLGPPMNVAKYMQGTCPTDRRQVRADPPQPVDRRSSPRPQRRRNDFQPPVTSTKPGGAQKQSTPRSRR